MVPHGDRIDTAQSGTVQRQHGGNAVGPEQYVVRVLILYHNVDDQPLRALREPPRNHTSQCPKLNDDAGKRIYAEHDPNDTQRQTPQPSQGHSRPDDVPQLLRITARGRAALNSTSPGLYRGRRRRASRALRQARAQSAPAFRWSRRGGRSRGRKSSPAKRQPSSPSRDETGQPLVGLQSIGLPARRDSREPLSTSVCAPVA